MSHIKVPEQTPKISYSVTTPEEDTFNINFVIFESDGSDINVFDSDVLLSPTLYTITTVPGTEGGFVGGTLVLDTPVTDTTIVIIRSLILERVTDFPTAGPFNITALNTELDRLTGMVQQINQGAVNNSVRAAESVTDSPELQFTELAAARSGKVLGFDTNGDIELQAGVGEWKNNWTTSVGYVLRDVIRDDVNGADTKNLYICVIAHTSGVWATDLAAAKWELMVDVESVSDSETAAAASAAAASTSETNAASSESNASTSASNASTSETNASTSETNAAASASAASTSETNAATAETNAANSAATINLPDISGSSVGDMIVVNSGKTGYDFAIPGIGDLISTNNLSDVSSAPTSLSNLGGIGSATTDTLTNKTIDANGTGNALSNIDIGNCIAASQAEAEAGTDNTKLLTSLRTAQAIAALGGGGGAWTLIGTVVASSDVSIEITGLTGAAFASFVFIISDLVPSVDGTNIRLRVGDSGGFDSGSSDYIYHLTRVHSGSSGYNASVIGVSPGLSVISVALAVGNAAGEGLGGVLYLTSPSDTSTNPVVTGTLTHIDNTGEVRGGSLVASRTAAIALDRIQLHPLSGDLTSGRLTAWGISHE